LRKKAVTNCQQISDACSFYVCMLKGAILT